MSRLHWLLAAGVAAFLLSLAWMMPAAVMLRWLPAGVAFSGLEGTIWSGSASAVAIGGWPVGRIHWTCRPWRLPLLEWSCSLRASPGGGDVSSHATGDFGNRVQLRNLRGQLPVAAFGGLVAPPGWTGNAQFELPVLRIEEGWPSEASGIVVVLGLRAPGPGGATLGDFELLLGEGAVGGESLSGRLSDRGGPLRVRATLSLRDDRSYLLGGEVAPGPGAGDTISRTLAFLGPPDSLGRRTFAIEGTL